MNSNLKILTNSPVTTPHRSVSDSRMAKFFMNNFKEDRWRKAALKNAYQLLGMQRFEHAAAFFLLAGSLWDAVQVRRNQHRRLVPIKTKM